MVKDEDLNKASTAHDHDHYHGMYAHHHGHKLLLALVGVLVLLMVFCFGMAAQRVHREPAMTFGKFGGIGMTGPRSVHMGRGFGFNNPNAAALTGKVTAVNGTSFTLDQNGSSKTIKTDDKTAFGGVGINGLKTNDQVTIVGTTNSDGSVQASDVRVIN
ncbi:MAG TPA: DUF5666 domain-containing protein [Candidatus Saccharimonadales bacterium]|nr:DUF5666 domain-containing protein [Candidatus Saccharimonadales bacterium]